MKSAFTHGVLAAFIVVSLWTTGFVLLMNLTVDIKNPLTYLLILVQMHLFTGLFITAHDAMHGSVSCHKGLNYAIGQLCTGLYAAFPFNRLNRKHHEHHRHVHTINDPDFHEGGFWSWYLNFMKEYISWQQLLIMAIAFNILKLRFSELNLFLFWILPSLLSTLQLFYFGTWLPHHGEQDNIHQSGSQNKNHVGAFLSCYFFGYHYQHHDAPAVPWWKLWKMK